MIVLGFGCNIGDRLENLRTAYAKVRLIPGICVEQVSPVYESDALLPVGAPDNWDQPYLNLAARISTKLNPEELLIHLKRIEGEMGRVDKHLRWSPRIMDIDILAWNEECLHTDKLNVPHAGLLERPFAMWPLADVSPDWKYCAPGKPETGKTAKELVEKFHSRFSGDAPFHTKQIAHRIDTPRIMGILNVTPDSFSDGGKFNKLESALLQIENLFAAGADIIDVGAESTRPAALGQSITTEEEWSRLRPILDTWQSLWSGKNFKPKLSIDTRNPVIAEKLLSYPVDFFNDQSGFENPKMLEIAAQTTAKMIFMHNLGLPVNPNIILPKGEDVVRNVYVWGQKQAEKIVDFGIDPARLIFDVGIGFGKTAEQSFSLIKNIAEFHKLNMPILVGHSRKSFLSQFTNKPFAERDLETATISGFLATQNVQYLRVHNVDHNMRLLKINASL